MIHRTLSELLLFHDFYDTSGSKDIKYDVDCQRPNSEFLDGHQRVEGAGLSYSGRSNVHNNHLIRHSSTKQTLWTKLYQYA